MKEGTLYLFNGAVNNEKGVGFYFVKKKYIYVTKTLSDAKFVNTLTYCI